jgi:transcriptional regulator with XRE-family HTH domain
MDAAKVGVAIKTLRLQAGYTQHDLADILGVTDQAVSKWERGLSVPDVSIVTKLSVLLNVDVDNLLEGNITYLEKTWKGLLILDKNEVIFSGSEAYGKPLVYLYLSYFMLAGIGEISVICPDRDKRYIGEAIGNGSKYGIALKYIEEIKQMESVNTMVVYNNPFVYGPNLTKYFQRAMSRPNGISVLTVAKTLGGSEICISYDNYRAVQSVDSGGINQFCAPIVFFPKKYSNQVSMVRDITQLEPLYAEPMGNGMIEYSITDEDALWDTSSFLRYLKKRMGKDVYDLEEVAKNRRFVNVE